MKAAGVSDEDLIRSIVSSESNLLFKEIYNRYYDKVYSKCYTMTRSKRVASDLTQDIFIKALEKLKNFEFKSKFATWLYALTYNYCIDYLRLNKRLRFNDWSENLEMPDEVDEAEIANVFELRQERLDLLLEVLKPEDKAILIMKYIDQLSLKQIQIILNLSTEGNVKMKINRAKKRLLALYNQFYSALED